MTLPEARKAANDAYDAHGLSPEYEAAMNIVRELVEQDAVTVRSEEFCSVDSGVHRTRLLDGRIIG